MIFEVRIRSLHIICNILSHFCRPSPDARRHHKSGSRQYVSRSPSRSPSSSRSRRNLPALQTKSKNQRHTPDNNSGMPKKTRVVSGKL